MDRRQFNKAVLTGAVAAATNPLLGADESCAAGLSAPLPPHPGDVLPVGAAARLGTCRFWHLAQRGNAGVNALAFSPDGRTVAALGYQDGCISLWEVPSGRMLRKWDADQADRRGELAFSPCGRLLAVASNDGLRLWDPQTGTLVRQFVEKQTCVYGVAFAPDGRLLAGAFPHDGRIDVWDVATGERVSRFEADPHLIVPDRPWENSDRFQSVAFSADGLLVAAGSEYDIHHDPNGPGAEALRQWLLECHRSCGTRGWGDRSYLVEPRGRVWCWELTSGRRVARLDGHGFPVKVVRFTRDGRLISCAADGEISVWDVRAGRRVGELAPSAGRAYETAAAFAADRRHAVLSRPNYLGLIDLDGGGEVRRFPVTPGWSGWRFLAVSADARWVVTDARGRLSLWDATSGEDVSPAGRHPDWVDAVRFTADGSRVVTASGGEALLWDAATARLLRRVAPDTFLLADTLVLAPDGQRAACVRRAFPSGPHGKETNGLFVWDWQTGDICLCDEEATAAAWSPAGEFLVVGTGRGEVYTLDLGTGRRASCLGGVAGGVKCVAVSADGRYAAVLVGAAFGDPQKVHVFSLSADGWRNRLEIPLIPREAFRYHGSFGWLSFSPDGRTLAMTVSRGHLCLAPIDGNSFALAFTPPPAPQGSVIEFATVFLSEGGSLAARAALVDGAEDGGPYAIRVWDVGSGREVWCSPPLAHPISALAFSRDGRMLASGAWDATALLWDLSAAR